MDRPRTVLGPFPDRKAVWKTRILRFRILFLIRISNRDYFWVLKSKLSEWNTLDGLDESQLHFRWIADNLYREDNFFWKILEKISKPSKVFSSKNDRQVPISTVNKVPGFLRWRYMKSNPFNENSVIEKRKAASIPFIFNHPKYIPSQLYSPGQKCFRIWPIWYGPYHIRSIKVENERLKRGSGANEDFSIFA